MDFMEDRRKNRDRRKAPRSAKSGSVMISVSEPLETTVEAELIETSDMGFRISHKSRDLVPAVVVQYSAAHVSGKARVIWTHVREGRYISGLMIL